MPTILVDESALDGDESSSAIIGSRPTLATETAGGQLTVLDPQFQNADVTFQLTGLNPEFGSGSYGTLSLQPAGAFSYTLEFPYFDEGGVTGRDIVSDADVFRYEAVIEQQPSTLTIRILDIDSEIEFGTPLLTNPYDGIVVDIDGEEFQFFWDPANDDNGVEAYQQIVSELNASFLEFGLTMLSASVGPAFNIPDPDTEPGGTATGYDIVITDSSGSLLEFIEFTVADVSIPTGADYFTDAVVSNGNPAMAIEQGTVIVNIRDDVPIAGDDAANLGRGSSAFGNVLDNDTFGADCQDDDDSSEVSLLVDGADGSEGDILGVRAAGSDLVAPASSGLGTEIQGLFGALVLAEDGSYSYVAHTELPNGVLQDRFVYTIADCEGDIDSAVITITLDRTVGTVNATAEVDESALDGDESSAAIVGTRPTLTTETASGVLTLSNAQIALTSVVFKLVGNGTGTYGTLTLADDGTYSYTLQHPFLNSSPAEGRDLVPAVELFQYRVLLDLGEGEDAVIQQGVITINVRDDIPVAQDDTATVSERQTTTGSVLTNDLLGADCQNADLPTVIGLGGGVVGVRAAGNDPTGPASGGLGAPLQGQYGTLTLLADGTYNYTAVGNLPTGAFQDMFVYSLADCEGDIDTATLTITVNGTNEPPSLDGGRLVILASQGERTVDFAANDPEGDDVILIADQPDSGTVDVNPDGSVTFRPESGFTGIGGFRLTVSDGELSSPPSNVDVIAMSRPDIDTPLVGLALGTETAMIA